MSYGLKFLATSIFMPFKKFDRKIDDIQYANFSILNKNIQLNSASGRGTNLYGRTYCPGEFVFYFMRL